METASTARLHEIINSSVSAAFHQEMALAFWRHPSESIIHGILGSAIMDEKSIEIETSAAGFILHPFDHIEKAGSWFIPADYHITLPLFGKIEISQDSEYYKKINSCLCDKKRDWFTGKNLPGILSDQQERYLELVQDGVNAINEKRFDKVICARTRHIKLQKDFSIGLFFRALIDTYPDAFVSCISHPRFGTWIGASPEILLEIDNNNQFKTIALAGTQPVNEPINPATAAWTQKEIQEQAMVSRFIINQFKKVRLREFVETGPKTTIAGNVMHLKTNYEVDLNEIDIEKLGSKMMRLLHPTSAVCGMPKLPSREFILREESFARDLYSGFWGPVNFHGLTSLNVNLRTMQLTKDEAIIYAGNGITHDSDPENEWLETELKCDTLLHLLK